MQLYEQGCKGGYYVQGVVSLGRKCPEQALGRGKPVSIHGISPGRSPALCRPFCLSSIMFLLMRLLLTSQSPEAKSS